nr:hypothetical protein [Tanacetum cinerariifolium]
MFLGGSKSLLVKLMMLRLYRRELEFHRHLVKRTYRPTIAMTDTHTTVTPSLGPKMIFVLYRC